MNIQILGKLFNEQIDSEMINIVETNEDTIQNATLIAIDNIITPKIGLAVSSIGTSFARDAVIFIGNWERGEHLGVIGSFENATDRIKTFQELNTSAETCGSTPEKFSKLWVPRTHFDWQSHSHHMVTKQITQTN